MGDLEFIQEKVIAGDYFQVSGDINALNDTIEFVVPNGRTAFLLEGKITLNSNPQIPKSNTAFTIRSNVNQIVADLLIDNVTKSKAKIGVDAFYVLGSSVGSGSGAGSGSGFGSDSQFNVKGLSLIGDGIKKIEIENVLDNGSAFAEFSGYLV